jgi:hypothetical protein
MILGLIVTSAAVLGMCSESDRVGGWSGLLLIAGGCILLSGAGIL